MKKFFFFIAVLATMAGCGGFVKNENGSENLVKLKAEPVGCTFLYKLESEVSVYDIDEQQFSNELYTCDIPDPDIVIRTSGEQRISNYLLWQIAYSELFFTKTLWPDFSVNELKEIINDFNSRERRYGKV
mgnify:CR=1 FL=1